MPEAQLVAAQLPEAQWVVTLSWGLIVCGVVAGLLLLFISAPYGRHAREGWGPSLPNRVAWFVMEVPASLVFFAVYFVGSQRASLTPLVLLGLWQVHYVHRAFIYPLSLKTQGKRAPLLTALIAVVFNTINAYVNARWISHLGDYPETWLTTPGFIIGASVFALGFAINKHSDAILRGLRSDPGASGYKIPRGGMYRFISCPNYFGEILEWTGWAIATSALPGFAFAIFTAANLVPRARTHHAWYREQFEDYPAERRALIPFVW
jgi:protein-S-isoprenylcysteine O-methyltransferase Ste14